MRRVAVVLVGCLLFGVVASVAGCAAGDPPPAPPPADAASSAAPSDPADAEDPDADPSWSDGPDPAPPFITPSQGEFSEQIAVGCNGRPSGDQVVAVVRRASLLPAGARPAITTGPLCAGTWQFTVLTLPDVEPLQVVTRGAPGSITLESAGTNPCTPRVRANAPPGILAVLHCT